MMAQGNSVRLNVVRYTTDQRLIWNRFISNASSAEFTHSRDYLSYSKISEDFSLLIFQEQKLLGVIPLSLDPHSQDILHCHSLCTFASVLMSPGLSFYKSKIILDSAIRFIQDSGFKSLYFRNPPAVLQHEINQATEYILISQYNADIVNCRPLQVLDLSDTNSAKMSKGRKSMAKKSNSNTIRFEDEANISIFHKFLSDQLHERHDKAPIHTSEDLENLKALFPNNVYFSLATLDDQPIAGVAFWVYKNYITLQYIASNEKGRVIGGVDFLVLNVIAKAKELGKKFVSFGTSGDPETLNFNLNLIINKEGYGARTIPAFYYHLKL
jgi:hypothetical protein